MNKNKQKGNRYERLIAQIFRDDFGFKFCKTSRNGSALIDSCKIDLINIPFNVQAKTGYAKSRPKYDKLYEEMKEELNKNFPKDHPLHSYPFVLVYKLDGRRPENHQWTFMAKDIIPILKDYFLMKKN